MRPPRVPEPPRERPELVHRHEEHAVEPQHREAEQQILQRVMPQSARAVRSLEAADLPKRPAARGAAARRAPGSTRRAPAFRAGRPLVSTPTVAGRNGRTATCRIRVAVPASAVNATRRLVLGSRKRTPRSLSSAATTSSHEGLSVSTLKDWPKKNGDRASARASTSASAGFDLSRSRKNDVGHCAGAPGTSPSR